MKTKQKYNVNKGLKSIVQTGRRSHNRGVSFRLAKLLEESGEFAEASLTRAGLLSKKIKHDEHVYEEACDTIILIVDTVACVYNKELEEGTLTEDQLIQNIIKWIEPKTHKWKKKEGIKDFVKKSSKKKE